MAETIWFNSGHDPKDLNLLHVPEVKVPEQVLHESLGGGLKVMF